MLLRYWFLSFSLFLWGLWDFSHSGVRWSLKSFESWLNWQILAIHDNVLSNIFTLFFNFFQVFFQLCIIATGNYNFFNILTIVLCVSLLDDDFLITKKKRKGKKNAFFLCEQFYHLYKMILMIHVLQLSWIGPDVAQTRALGRIMVGGSMLSWDSWYL